MEKKPELADHWFMQWWLARIVERRPLHEVPAAWLAMHLSIALQEKNQPF